MYCVLHVLCVTCTVCYMHCVLRMLSVTNLMCLVCRLGDQEDRLRAASVSNNNNTINHQQQHANGFPTASTSGSTSGASGETGGSWESVGGGAWEGGVDASGGGRGGAGEGGPRRLPVSETVLEQRTYFTPVMVRV